MADDLRTTATELRAPRGARAMEIDWQDGVTSKLPYELVRGFCPCANCQGHQGPIVLREGFDLDLREVEEVGGYALRLVWGDGHGTGLYSFRYLRQLGDRVAVGGDPHEWSFGR